MNEMLSSDVVMKVGMRGYQDCVSYNWHGKMIDIRYLLPREEEIELVHSILKCCGEDVGDGYIIPELMDLAIRANVVAFYACVELPETIDEQHRLLYHSDLYDVVLKNGNHAQIKNVIESVYRYL